LWDLKKSPHVAVVLGIEADHLDVHDDMHDYIEAKARIATYQTNDDKIVYNQKNSLASGIAKRSLGRHVPYPDDSIASAIADSLVIPGQHNIENASAAVLAVSEYVTDEKAIKNGLSSFTGLPHRLKFVGEKEGVKYYDDSIATTPGSAIAALNSFVEPKVIILGGHDKGSDYTELIQVCKRVNATVIAIGSNGPTLAELCRQAGVACREERGDIISIVASVSRIAEPGSVVILSPAAASFDMFKSYADRGDQFIAAVNAL
jgi:UDP-N-acetylmuramoylalanine--D-glutamate ligase